VAYVEYKTISKGKRDSRPIISLRLNSKIRLNMAGAQLLLKNEIKRVRVLWDGPKRKIALAAADADDPYAYMVYMDKRQNYASIGIRSFGEFIGLVPGPTVKVYANYVAAHKILEATVPFEAFGAEEPRKSKASH
jgi:hypothetical protein